MGDASEGDEPRPRWPETLSLLLAAGCALVALARAAALRGWLPRPEVPYHLGDIALWAFGAFCILWGMDRGAPGGGLPSPRLRLYRFGVLIAALVMLGVWIYG